MNDIDNLKEKDLVQYATSKGYDTVQKGKLSSIWLTLKNSSTNDSIRIRQKPLPMVYTNNDEFLNQDRGNIINFEINRLSGAIAPTSNPTGKDFAIAIKNLNKHFNIISNQTRNLEKIKISKPSRSSGQDANLKIKNLLDKDDSVISYLSDNRSISKSTLNHVYFSGIIKASPVILPNGKIITNTAFVKKDLDKNIQGFTAYFYQAKTKTNAKRITSKKNIPITSNILKDSNHLIIAESPIDALSHLELNKPKNSVYVAGEGSLSPEKLAHIFDVYSEIKNANLDKPVSIASINDNDVAGYKFDIEISTYFYNKIHKNSLVETQQKENSIKFTLQNKVDIPISKLKDDIIYNLELESKTKAYNSLVNIGQTKDFTFIEIPNFKSDNTKNLKLFLRPISQLFFDLSKIEFKHNKSRSKDWNDDLKLLKKKMDNTQNLDKTAKINNNTNKSLKV